MEPLYQLGIWLYGRLLRLAAAFGHKQAKKWVAGRRQWPQLAAKILANKRVVWFHTASAGEFEQGRPLIEHHRRYYPKDFIVVTFFSPSGYELRKDYAAADLICYLPEDRPSEVQRWLEYCKPALAVFIKYEFWFNHYRELKRRNIPLLLVSAPFRPSQPFFHPLTQGFWRKMLNSVTHFFVQDATSAALLRGIGYQNVSVCGDTRADRVLELASEPWIDPLLEAFSRNSQVLVAGSTWLADEILIEKALATAALHDLKLLIAPHELSAKRNSELLERFGTGTVLYTHTKTKEAGQARVMVLNTMGMLSRAYRYGQMAYVGGGFGKGIHNTLEAAVYGIPLCFGPKNQKFLEAQALLREGLAIEVHQPNDLAVALQEWRQAEKQIQLKNKAARWFATQAGATVMVTREMTRLLGG